MALHAANMYLFSVGLGPVTILGAGIQITQSVLMEPTGEKKLTRSVKEINRVT